MSLWRQLTRGLRVLTRRHAADREVSEELTAWIDQATEANISRGMSSADARRAAILEMGNVTVAREQMRSSGWENAFAVLIADLRYAIRGLFRSSGFTVVSVLTLALGIGATTAIFSILKPILFDPLPYPNGKQIVMIWDQTVGGSRLDGTFGTYLELLKRNHSFETIAAVKTWEPVLTTPTEPEQLEGQSVSATYFHVLGVPPALGRDFDASDDRPQGPAVIILSDGLWRRRFGADVSIVGRQVVLDDTLYTVIGVMPRGFENILASSAELWSPLQYDTSLPPQSREWGHHLRLIGRMRRGISEQHAREDLNAIARTPIREFTRQPWASLKGGLIVNPLLADMAWSARPVLLAVLGAVLIVLTIACVNVVNLLLARGAQRIPEFAVRAALGASRLRLVRQLLTETLVLALAGGILGIVVAQLVLPALLALSPQGLPRVYAIHLDRGVFAFAAAVTTLVGLLVGLAPALAASREGSRWKLQEASKRSTSTRSLTRRLLVVAETALALVLLVSAGLLIRSLHRLFAVNPGFSPAHVITMRVQTSGHRFHHDPNVTSRFFSDAAEAVRNVRGVTEAGFTSLLPLSGDPYGSYGIRFPGSVPGQEVPAFRYAVTPGYFQAMGITLRSGRTLEAHDRVGAPVALVVSESLAQKHFGKQNPIGQRIHIGPDEWPWATVVGVVSNVKQTSLAAVQQEAFYLTAMQSWFADGSMSLVVRARGEPATLVPAIESAIWSVDKNQAITNVVSMEELVAETAAQQHFAMILFQSFGALALVLAMIGIYGVLSGSVSERIREIGIRSALGASRGAILTLVLRQGLKLAAFGILFGLTAAVIATRAIGSLLFGISELDPPTYAGVIVLLVGVSLVACWAPAWRASRVDPAITLRAE